MDKQLVVFDLETTGGEPENNGIIQIGAARLRSSDWRIKRTFETLVETEYTISEGAYERHGLTAEDLQGEPSIEEALERFDDFLPAHPVLCGYNVTFDIGFLRPAYRRSSNKSFRSRHDYHYVDAWSMVFAFANAGKNGTVKTPTLEGICEQFGFEHDRAHDALADVEQTARIMQKIREKLDPAVFSTLIAS